MGLVRTVAPALEPLTVAEVARHLGLDETTGEPTPPAPSVALAAPAVPGNVDNGTHRYRVTFVTADGETNGGDISDVVTVADKTVNGQVALTNIPIGGSAVTSRKLYRTEAGGSTYLLLATIANNVATTYTDNIADAALGAQVPSTNTTADAELTAVIATAREEVETFLRRALITQTWQLTLDRFPGDDFIRLPRPNLLTVESIEYIDTLGATQTLSTDDYDVDTASLPGRILLAYGASWPLTRSVRNAVTITFTAGYGPAASDVPASIKAAMKLLIGDLFSNREAVIVGTIVNQMPAAQRLLWAHRYLELS
jgi:uncharacterized phiE125 gp8 family phage protein